MYFDELIGYDITLCSNGKCKNKNKCLRYLERREDIQYPMCKYNINNKDNCFIDMSNIDLNIEKAEEFVKGNSKFIGVHYYRNISNKIYLFHAPDYDIKLNHKEYPFLYFKHGEAILWIGAFTKERYGKLLKDKQLVKIK